MEFAANPMAGGIKWNYLPFRSFTAKIGRADVRIECDFGAPVPHWTLECPPEISLFRFVLGAVISAKDAAEKAVSVCRSLGLREPTLPEKKQIVLAWAIDLDSSVIDKIIETFGIEVSDAKYNRAAVLDWVRGMDEPEIDATIKDYGLD